MYVIIHLLKMGNIPNYAGYTRPKMCYFNSAITPVTVSVNKIIIYEIFLQQMTRMFYCSMPIIGLGKWITTVSNS